VGEETAGLTALVPVVGLLAVGVVADGEGVLVLGAEGVGRDHGRGVGHALAHLGHVVALEEGGVLLLLVVALEALLGALVEPAGVLGLLLALEKAGAGEGNELLALVFASEGSFGDLVSTLQRGKVN
jgi:hypothetical protein